MNPRDIAGERKQKKKNKNIGQQAQHTTDQLFCPPQVIDNKVHNCRIFMYNYTTQGGFFLFESRQLM